MVVGLVDVDSRQLRELLARQPSKLGVGVDAGADRRAAQRQRRQLVLRHQQSVERPLDEPRIALELLSQPDGGGIHQVGAAGLDDCVELHCLRLERRLQREQRRQQLSVQLQQR